MRYHPSCCCHSDRHGQLHVVTIHAWIFPNVSAIVVQERKCETKGYPRLCCGKCDRLPQCSFVILSLTSSDFPVRRAQPGCSAGELWGGKRKRCFQFNQGKTRWLSDTTELNTSSKSVLLLDNLRDCALVYNTISGSHRGLTMTF